MTRIATIAAFAVTASHLNMIGLVLNMAGVAILFFWGPPQPDLDPHTKMVLVQQDEATKRLRRRHLVTSGFGLVLLFFGFGAQFIALLR
jgi:hypothetical protein